MSDTGLNELNALLARVPSVERLVSSAPLRSLVDSHGRTRVLAAVRAALDAWREAARRDPAGAVTPDEA
ncbi:L-seryl-tRNA(Sec) selenium transferase, partial [Burkholderia gladioli]|nr:L-seryl-tRNA(Sec) selenium transferase [Burkholderia gladioli]